MNNVGAIYVFMHDVWTAGLTISGHKSAIGNPGINIVGMVCDYDGTHLEEKKVSKIVNRPVPQSTRDARAFVGLVVYYCIFIESFARSWFHWTFHRLPP
jgi:hypothetical protein